MTPAEEDALIEAAILEAGWPDRFRPCKEQIGMMRLAIRAAVAAERERCAKWHDKRAKMCEDSRLCMLQRGHDEEASNLLRMQNEHTESAAAIREGTK